jgi:preprotein translocase subunit SecA
MLRADKEEIESLLSKISGENEGFDKIIEEKKSKIGDEAFYETVRRIALYTTDTLWMEHLEAMDYLRSSVNLRAYGQREPIVEYKKEGLFMFKEMERAFYEQVFSLVSTMNTEQRADRIQEENNLSKQTLVTSHTESTNSAANTDNTIGRNDPCPCGSGKKYKKCGMLNTEEHQKLMIQK